ncbi:MAG: transporter substrate-binding protein [Hyphomicrobiales bacterium]|nr:transporter substrate-binding protein [Hyphomicrobiales bacterium]
MQFRPEIGEMDQETRKLLAPSGVLRAGINMSNFLLVSERSKDGGPAGVSPDMAAAIANSLGLAIEYVPYPNPGVLADAAGKNEWDIALIGAEPQRAEVIAFTPAYSEIEATYLVPAGSPLRALDDVDVKGVRIAVAERTAYGLWLERNIRNAELVPASGLDGSLNAFRDGKLDALAGLRPRLITDVQSMPGARLLEGRFMAVQQAVGVPRTKAAAVDWLNDFVEAARTQGFVAQLIGKFGVSGLSVA